jgi:hypothetical protein
MQDIIIAASRDADLSKRDIKRIARENAQRRYPRGAKVMRGLYKHTFIRKVRYYEYQAWTDELNSYR